eukprot:m.424835 g.424835  ORF g.424835 m.424835 type:complete len:424 (-) comp49014_c0_seq1:70-1341(-)
MPSAGAPPAPTNAIGLADAGVVIPVRTFLAEFSEAYRDLASMGSGAPLGQTVSAGTESRASALSATPADDGGGGGRGPDPDPDAVTVHSPGGDPTPTPTLPPTSTAVASADGAAHGSVRPLLPTLLHTASGDPFSLEQLVAASTECPLRTVLDSRKHGLLSGKIRKEEYIPVTKRAKGRTGRHVGHQAAAGAAAGGGGARAVGEEVVLTVEYYHPRKRLKLGEFEVRGDHQLWQLRDMFECVDEINFTVNSTTGPPDVHPPGYLFIEDTFYDDHRSPTRYSDPVIDWLDKQAEMVTDRTVAALAPRYARRDMRMKFVDLSVRLHYPYLYAHHGDCEHHVVFTDITLVPKSEASLSEPPQCLWMTTKHRQDCMICGTFASTLVIHNNIMLPHNPCFYCSECKDAVEALASTNGTLEVFKYSYDG